MSNRISDLLELSLRENASQKEQIDTLTKMVEELFSEIEKRDKLINKMNDALKHMAERTSELNRRMDDGRIIL